MASTSNQANTPPPTQAQILQALKLKRGTLKASLTKLKTAVDGYTSETISQGSLDAHQRRLDGLWVELQKNHDEIIAASADETERNAHQTEFDEVDSKVLDVQATLNNAILQLLQPTNDNQSNTSQLSASLQTPSGHNVSVNLPKLSLPVFAGEVHDWLTFNDMFTSLVHNNASLSDVHKLQYLKSSLRGDAARLLNSVSVTNANYQKSWEMLERRYVHERVMVFAHLQRLFDQPSLIQESSSALRKLIGNINESVRALENLNRPTDQWDDILVYMTMQKLDPETRRRLELSLTDKSVPTFDYLMELLEQQSIALDTMRSSQAKIKNPHDPNKQKNAVRGDNRPVAKAHVAATDNKPKCHFCEEHHNVFQCNTFNSKTIADRVSSAMQLKLCLNCLRPGHFATNCSSPSSCKSCKKRHHSLLRQIPTADNAVVSAHISKESHPKSQVLLATAVVDVKDSTGAWQHCRILLDSGSQASFIEASFAKKLGLRREASNIHVTGIGAGGIGTLSEQVSVQISSRVEPTTILAATALVLQKGTSNLPSFACNPAEWKHLSGLRLADPWFHEPHNVDLLIGADLLPEIMRPNIVRGPPQTPIAQETLFGWIIFGPASFRTKTAIVAHVDRVALDSALEKFWELEEVTPERKFTAEEKACESHFNSTHIRNPDGSYTVRLPFKENPKATLGNSYEAARRRFSQLERLLQANSELRRQYTDFMNEYLNMGHMELVPEDELEMDCSSCYYLPHHPVFKESSTTQVRVVFDASAKTTTGVSLNDNLMVGPGSI